MSEGAGARVPPPPTTGPSIPPPAASGSPSASQAAPPASPPPGWYYDGSQMRWWDGATWGVPAPPPLSKSNDREFSMLAHGGLLMGGFIAPLVLYLIANDEERPETRFHAREALNFQLTFMLVYVAASAAFFVGLFTSGIFDVSNENPVAPTPQGVPFGFLGVFGFGMVAYGLNLVFSIVGAVRASRGVRWKYPVRIPFVRG